MTQELNIQTAFDNVEKAIKAKKLQFFDSEFMAAPPSFRGCVYNQPNGYGCAIGVSLERPILDPVMNNTSVSTLLVKNIIKTDNENAIMDLQSAHDDACKQPSTSIAKKFFRKKLTDLKKQYNIN